MNRHLLFQVELAKKKPNTTRNQHTPCPFCDYETLKKTNIVLQEATDKLLIQNKFPTFEQSYQTVFIESKDCHRNLANYEKNDLYDILLFGFAHWFELSQNPAFQSVLFYKNHGAEASASIQHPHMQLIGLKDIDYHANIQLTDFEGDVIFEEASFQWNISTQPKNELYEFNLLIDKRDIMTSLSTKKTKAFERFCLSLQHTIHFVLTTLCTESQSFNLVFYEIEGKVVAKVIPRNPLNGARITALHLGYNISMLPSNIDEMKIDIKNTYLPFDI